MKQVNIKIIQRILAYTVIYLVVILMNDIKEL